jgi:TP901 family phage tail tape measure protein
MARDPKAEVEISAHSRNLGAKLREARAKFGKWGAELKKEVFGDRFFSRAGAQAVGNLASNAIGMVGGFLADQAKEAFNYADALNRLQIAADGTPEQMVALDKAIRSASDETGISKAQTLAAARQYVALTGDLEGATAAIQTWDRVAQAADANVADVASTAQALRDNLKIRPAEMEAAFSALIVQGKQGAVELKDLAGQLAVISPLMAQFGGGTGLKGLRDLGATVQVVRKGFGGTEETITGVQSLMTALIKNAKRFQAAGIQVFDKDPKTGVKTLKSFVSIVDAIANSKLMKDPTKLEKAFGRVEAFRAFLQLKDNKDMLDQLIEKSNDVNAVQRDLSKRMTSPAARVKQAWEQAKNVIMDAFTPARAETFAKAIIGVAQGLAGVVKGLGSVLDKAEAVGKGWAKIIGGESEEDRISHLQAKRLDERRARMGADFDRLHPNATPEERAKAVSYELVFENMLIDRLQAQIKGEAVDRQIYSEQEGRGVYRNAGEYSVPELIALKKVVHGSSDEGRTQQLIDQAIAKAIEKQTQAITLMAQAMANKAVHVNVDGNKLVTAHRNAADHARRPGG